MTNIISGEHHKSVEHGITSRVLAFIITESDKSGVIKHLIHTAMDQRN